MSTGIGHKWLIKGQELHVDTPLIMGILNVTPDSFSDGGKFVDPSKAVSRAFEMLDQGATIIDIGGESTRPGSLPVESEKEIARVIPIIRELSKTSDAFISIDTQKSSVAEAAIQAGAHIVNDISAGLNDEKMFSIIRDYQAGCILMHMQGNPKTMQVAPNYKQVVEDVSNFLAKRIQMASVAGIDSECIVLDPGIGFGKKLEDNLSLIGNMNSLNRIGRPLLLGASRKSFIGMIDNSTTENRLGGSLAAVIAAYTGGARLFRVHDVAETRQVLDIFTAIQKHSD